MIAADATAPSTADHELPSAYAIGGSASVASVEPSEMYFVSHTTVVKIAMASVMAIGVTTRNTPQAVATPLPPRKRSHTG